MKTIKKVSGYRVAKRRISLHRVTEGNLLMWLPKMRGVCSVRQALGFSQQEMANAISMKLNSPRENYYRKQSVSGWERAERGEISLGYALTSKPANGYRLVLLETLARLTKSSWDFDVRVRVPRLDGNVRWHVTAHADCSRCEKKGLIPTRFSVPFVCETCRKKKRKLYKGE